MVIQEGINCRIPRLDFLSPLIVQIAILISQPSKDRLALGYERVKSGYPRVISPVLLIRQFLLGQISRNKQPAQKSENANADKSHESSVEEMLPPMHEVPQGVHERRKNRLGNLQDAK
jgi:hypothetical protein